MIIKIFSGVGKGPSKGPINYLLGKDAHGKERAIEPRIFQGSKHATAFLIDQNHRANKYTSGVVAFRDEEKPTYEQLKTMCEDFQQTFLPAMTEDDVPILWVMHREKGNIEMHFLIPKQSSKGKAFNAFPPGEKNIQLMEAWQKLENDKFGFKQVTTDGFTASYKTFEKFSRKPQFSRIIKKLAKEGKINDRQELIKFLKSQGHQVTRAGEDYISVKFSDKDRPIRFRGEIFKADADYKKLLNTRSSETLSRLDKAIAINQVEQLVDERTRYNLKTFHSIKKSRFENTKRKNNQATKGTGRSSFLSTAKACRPHISHLAPPLRIDSDVASPMTSLEAKGDSLAPSLQERSELAPPTKPIAFNFDNLMSKLSTLSLDTSHHSSSSILSIDLQIGALLAQMSSSSDLKRTAELQLKINILIAKKTEQAFKEKHDKEKSISNSNSN